MTSPDFDFHHYIVIRYNVPCGFAPDGRNLDPVWLAKRLELFANFTIPSLALQAPERLSVALIMDLNTSRQEVGDVVAQLRRLPCEWFVLYSGAASWEPNLTDNLKDLRHGYIITTRLDSDDALSSGYVSLVNNVARVYTPTDHLFVSATTGYSYTVGTEELRLFTNPGGPFVSLIEPVTDKLQTVYCGNHREIRDGKNNLELAPAMPMWLQVDHGDNVSNRAFGKPLSDIDARLTLKKDFGILI